MTEFKSKLSQNSFRHEPYMFLESKTEHPKKEPVYMFGKYSGASWVNKKYFSNLEFSQDSFKFIIK